MFSPFQNKEIKVYNTILCQNQLNFVFKDIEVSTCSNKKYCVVYSWLFIVILFSYFITNILIYITNQNIKITLIKAADSHIPPAIHPCASYTCSQTKKHLKHKEKT